MKKLFKLLLLVLFIIPINVFALDKQYDLTNKYGIKVTVSTDYETIIEGYNNSTECDNLGVDEDKLMDYMDSLNAYVLATTPDLQKNIIFTRTQDEYTKDYYNLTNIDEDVVNALADGFRQGFNTNNYNLETINNITYMIFKYDLVSVQDEHLYYLKYKTFYNGYDYTIYIQKYSEITADEESELRDIVNKVEIPEIKKSNNNDLYNSSEIFYLFLIGIPLTAVCYMIIPFILVVILKKKYDKKSVKKMALCNSIFVGVAILIITTIIYKGEGYVWSAGPAFLYYFINCAVWVYRGKKEKVKNKNVTEEKDKTNNEVKEIIHEEEILETDDNTTVDTIDEGLYDEAVLSYKSSNYDEAVSLFNKYIEQVLKANKNEKKWTTCNNMLEFYLYCYTENLKEEIQDLNYRVNTAYLYLAMIDYDNGENEKAITNINKGLKYDPADTNLLFEKAENYKALHDMKKFYDNTLDIYKYIYTKSDLAKYYRNLGYYYIEKKDYELAKALYLYSLRFENNKIVNKELEYIISKSDDSLPAKNRLENILSKNNIPLFIDENVIDIIIKLDKELKTSNNGNTSFGKFINQIREELQI